MLKLAQRSTDELFSIALYNWLIQVDLADKLLQVSYIRGIICWIVPLNRQVHCNNPDALKERARG